MPLPKLPPSEVVMRMPKGTRMKDFIAGWGAAKDLSQVEIDALEETIRDLSEGQSRQQDMLEIYSAHIESLDQTRKVYRGMLKKQGREIRSLRAKAKRMENFWQAADKTNSRLARSYNASSEILWKVAGLASRDQGVISLKQAARNCIAERIRMERDG
jgi:chromosome segregation ATPase